MFEAPRGYSVLGGQREATTRDDDDDLLQFAIQQSLLEAGSEYDQVRPRRPRGGLPTGTTAPPPQLTGSNRAPQVTIWEALTNSKPGTHPMSYEGRRQDRSVSARPERVLKRLCPHPRLHTQRTRPGPCPQRIRPLPAGQPTLAQRNRGPLIGDPAGVKVASFPNPKAA